MSPTHPGEQHIRSEMLSAIVDHFNDVELPIDGVSYTFDWVEDSLPNQDTLAVFAPTGREVARYRIKLNAERIAVPASLTPRPVETVELPTEAPAIQRWTRVDDPSTWTQGVWGDVWDGDGVLGADGQEWEVGLIKAYSGNGLVDVYLSIGEGQELELALPVTQEVKYRRYPCSTPPEADQPEAPAVTDWIDGTWGDVGTGDVVMDDSGTPWEVTRHDGTSVTISRADQSYTFDPGDAALVKYRTLARSEGV